LGKTIIYDGKYIFVSDEVAAFLEADRKRQVAEERSDRRHISKSSSEPVSGPIYTLYVNGVEDVVFRNLALQKLRKVLNSLPKESRELIELYYYDEYTMEQIGRMYGISKMAVSKRIKKLLAAMRGLMETWDPTFVLNIFQKLVYKPLISVLISRGNFRKHCVTCCRFLIHSSISATHTKELIALISKK